MGIEYVWTLRIQHLDFILFIGHVFQQNDSKLKNNTTKYSNEKFSNNLGYKSYLL